MMTILHFNKKNKSKFEKTEKFLGNKNLSEIERILHLLILVDNSSFIYNIISQHHNCSISLVDI